MMIEVMYIHRKDKMKSMCSILHIATDWWGIGATILSGIITAVATMGAVIYTNNRTNKQLREQEEKHRKEQLEQFKLQKYVVIKPTLLVNSFVGILDKIIVQNEYSRVLLLSGDDGFEFFDDSKKRISQAWRMLLIENNNANDVKSVAISTKSILLNLDTDERYVYETYNAISLLRGKESIIVRLLNQTQYMKNVEMSKERIPSTLDFCCKIEYSTLAHQRITYTYQIRINNDNRIEIIKDGVENIVDEEDSLIIESTIFRNLQDYISGIDRSNYYWEKMGQAQMRGIMAQFNTNPIQQSTSEEEQNDVRSDNGAI